MVTNDETIAMTVAALRQLIAARDSSTFWLRLQPREDSSGPFRDVEIAHVGYNENEYPELLFRLRENGVRILRETRVSTSEIFTLVENVRELIAHAAGK